MDFRLFPRPSRAAAALIVVVLLGVGAVLAYPALAPKPSTVIHQQAPAAMGAPLLQGSFRDGAIGHHASGTVAVLRTAEGYALRLENYDATAGPDVYFFLSPVADPSTAEHVERGLRVLVPGGQPGGQATLRGDFNIPLPSSFDPTDYRSLVVWCDMYNVFFGVASLA